MKKTREAGFLESGLYREARSVGNWIKQISSLPREKREDVDAATEAWRPGARNRNPSIHAFRRIIRGISPKSARDRLLLDLVEARLDAMRHVILSNMLSLMSEARIEVDDMEGALDTKASLDACIVDLKRIAERPWDPARAAAVLSPPLIQASVDCQQAIQAGQGIAAAERTKSLAIEACLWLDRLL